MSLTLILGTMDTSRFSRAPEDSWLSLRPEWPSPEAPPHPVRELISKVSKTTMRTTFCASNGTSGRLKICLRSRFGQLTAESGARLGYALWNMIELFYEAGTLVASGVSSGLPEPFVWDEIGRAHV